MSSKDTSANFLENIDVTHISQRVEFTPQAFGEFPAESFTFSNALNPQSARASQGWFSGETTASTNYLKHLQKNFNLPQWAASSKVCSQLLGTEKAFKDSTLIPWSSSEFAVRFAATLEKLGGSTYLLDSPRGAGIEVIAGIWTLSDGKAFPIIGEAWRNNETGDDFVYWHFDALTHSRHFHLKPHPAVQFFLPLLFQSVAFLSETNDPNTRSTVPTREEVFCVGDSSRIPALTFHAVKDHYRPSVGFDEKSRPEFSFSWAAECVRYGYVFNQIDDVSDIEVAISVTTSAIPKAANILVDGFCNHVAGSGGNFQEITFSDDSIYKAGEIDHFARGIFIAGPMAQVTDTETLFVYARCEELTSEALAKKDAAKLRLALNGYQEIMSRGSGYCLPHAINGYVYMMQNFGGSILGLSDAERADFAGYGAMLLKYAARLPVDLQDANALSNLALLEIARKDLKAALACVNSGITLLKEDRSFLPESGCGNSRPSENPHIKLELFSTRAELLYRAGEVAKAKDIASKVLEEANSLGYDGPDIKKVKWILEH